jgi:hypothetical protein
MNKDEIIESGFFLAFINRFVDHEVHEGYRAKDQLLYALCDTEEENRLATLEEIDKIRKTIKEMGHEDLSLDFIYSFKYPSPFHGPGNQTWEELFYDNFIDEFEILFPYSDYYYKLKKQLENENNNDVISEIIQQQFGDEGIDFVHLIECETDLLNSILKDIEEFKKNDSWVLYFDFDFYRQYVEESEPFKILFEYCDLLVQLERLKMFYSFLEVEEEESKTNGKPLTNESSDYKESNTISTNELKQKNLSDFLIGVNIKKPLLDFLLADFSGKKGKDIAIMILALETNSLIVYTKRTELFNAIRVDFGNIGSAAGINKYMPDPKCMPEKQKETVALYAEKIKKHIENLPR